MYSVVPQIDHEIEAYLAPKETSEEMASWIPDPYSLFKFHLTPRRFDLISNVSDSIVLVVLQKPGEIGCSDMQCSDETGDDDKSLST